MTSRFTENTGHESLSTPSDGWTVLATRAVLDRRPWLHVWEDDVILPNGSTIDGYLRSVARDYAMTFAVTTDGKIPLVSQYKHGLGSCSYDLPAGYLETPQEGALAAAQRELREETGFVAESWRELGHLVIDSNRGPTAAHIYFAFGAERRSVQHLDPTEELTFSLHTPEDLREKVYSGQINSLATVAGIMMGLDILTSER